jgi:hypothetical protein
MEEAGCSHGAGIRILSQVTRIPPYDGSGQSTKTKRVFIQDYLTSATFKIGQNSLKNAYTTIPDLRASQISLGLSVDLQWRPGLNFNVDF